MWTVNAPAVSFDDNDRDRISLVECKRGQTFPIKKNIRQLDEHSVRCARSYYFCLSSLFALLEFLQWPFRLVAQLCVANSKSHILLNTQSKGENGKESSDWLCHRTRCKEIPHHIRLRFYNRSREWTSVFFYGLRLFVIVVAVAVDFSDTRNEPQNYIIICPLHHDELSTSFALHLQSIV